MNRDDYANLLQSHDDPVGREYPPGMDYSKQVSRFRHFVSELEERLGQKLQAETESHIQDASFHSQVLIGGAYLRFITNLLAAHGYVCVPHDLLEEDYTGEHPGVTGIRDWWIRYFDWV